MGKFDWKGAAEGALGSLYQSWEANQNEKRAYARQDREMAQQLYAKMLESGVDPASLNMDAAGVGKYMQNALKQLGPLMAEAENRRAKKELDKLFNERLATHQADYAAEGLGYTEPEAVDPYKGVAEPVKAVLQHFNISVETARSMRRRIRVHPWLSPNRSSR